MKKRLYIVELEPIEKRYTKQWSLYLPVTFSDYFNVSVIAAPLSSDKIDKGKFLDINKTNVCKAHQIKVISEKFDRGDFKDGDSFFFADGWNYAITAVKYMAQLNNLKIKIYAYWHAGTWDEYDFISQAGLREWAFHNEIGWMKACDCNFVSTNFHKKLIMDYFGSELLNNVKIEVVGFPMDWKAEIESLGVKPNQVKENLVVFPHRIDKEKSPEVFDKIAKELKYIKFIKTMDVTNNKKEYYELLSKAKIVFSASKQETFGIGTVEAMMLGAIPVVPDGLSYTELYNDIFKYKTLNEAKKMIKNFMVYYGSNRIQSIQKENIEKIRIQSLNSVSKMARVMLNE